MRYTIRQVYYSPGYFINTYGPCDIQSTVKDGRILTLAILSKSLSWKSASDPVPPCKITSFLLDLWRVCGLRIAYTATVVSLELPRPQHDPQSVYCIRESTRSVDARSIIKR